MTSNTKTACPLAEKFFLVSPGDVLRALVIKTYEPKLDDMSQKDSCEISVCTKAQQLSRDH